VWRRAGCRRVTSRSCRRRRARRPFIGYAENVCRCRARLRRHRGRRPRARRAPHDVDTTTRARIPAGQDAAGSPHGARAGASASCRRILAVWHSQQQVRPSSAHGGGETTFSRDRDQRAAQRRAAGATVAAAHACSADAEPVCADPQIRRSPRARCGAGASLCCGGGGRRGCHAVARAHPRPDGPPGYRAWRRCIHRPAHPGGPRERWVACPAPASALPTPTHRGAARSQA